MFKLHQRISLASLPTPLQPLDRLSEKLGGPRIWIKRDDLTGTVLSGNKVRKLEYVVAQALEDDASVLMTCGGVQSNHCRTTALVAAQLGLACHLILRGKKPDALDGNTLLAGLSGAEISYYAPREYSKRSNDIIQQWVDSYAKRGQKVCWIPTGASDEVGLWGYYSAAEELYGDFERKRLNVGAVCCATGSGGTHTGLALGFHHLAIKHKSPAPKVQAYAVCDNTKYFEDRAEHDIAAWYQRYHPAEEVQQPKVFINDCFIGSGYGVANEGVYETIRLLARTEGVILDPVYTGKAFQGMLNDIASGVFSDCENIVFVHTGGVFGLFPYRESLM